jgi:(p)ppGpp synthase/HD superfamily hydrolase
MPAYSPRYEAALTLAARAHLSQTRKGLDSPYLVHPVHVSVILIRYGFDEDVAVAGLLHDVVEDQDVPLAEIEAGFGAAVAEMVGALSERKREGQEKRPWLARKQEALEQLRRASSGAVAVKAADVLHNARSLAAHLHLAGSSAWELYNRGPQETLWYYRSALDLASRRLGAHSPGSGQAHPLIEELAQAIGDLEERIDEMKAA